jgi:hypothetical protein
MDLSDPSQEWYDATSELDTWLQIERSQVAEQIIVLGEIAAAIKREAADENLDPYWADFVAKVSAIDFSVNPDHLDRVPLLQGECELAAAAGLEGDSPDGGAA